MLLELILASRLEIIVHPFPLSTVPDPPRAVWIPSMRRCRLPREPLEPCICKPNNKYPDNDRRESQKEQLQKSSECMMLMLRSLTAAWKESIHVEVSVTGILFRVAIRRVICARRVVITTAVLAGVALRRFINKLRPETQARTSPC